MKFYSKIGCVFPKIHCILYFTIVSLFLNSGSLLLAQSVPPQFDFYQIRDAKKAYYDANPSLKSTAGSGYKDFLR